MPTDKLKAKANAKAAKAANASDKATKLAAGLTKTMKQAIKGDSVTCTKCASTKLGPKVCKCKSGGTKPSGDYDPTTTLIAAAEARHKAQLKDKKKNANVHQEAMAKEREKKKQARAGEAVGLGDGTVFQGDGNSIVTVVEFPPGKKLGFKFKKNTVNKVNQAVLDENEVKVELGWSIYQIGGEDIETNSQDQIDEMSVMRQFKAAAKKGPIRISFCAPITAEFVHCAYCNKFVGKDKFSEDQIEEGPGAQVCEDCEEFADMF